MDSYNNEIDIIFGLVSHIYLISVSSINLKRFNKQQNRKGNSLSVTSIFFQSPWNTGCKHTRRIAIANGTCVSFCNQPKAKFGYLTRVMPVCCCLNPFCGWRHLAMSRESKEHFGLPWVRPWDNRGKCHIDEKRIQCLSNALQHATTYLQPFPSNSTRRFKSLPF